VIGLQSSQQPHISSLVFTHVILPVCAEALGVLICCTEILLFSTKIPRVKKMFQTLLLCITSNAVCSNLVCACVCVLCMCLCLCVYLYVRVCMCMQVCTDSGILHWIKWFWRWYFIVITFYKYNFRKYTIGNSILEEKEFMITLLLLVLNKCLL
jgi:hypothetical protein